MALLRSGKALPYVLRQTLAGGESILARFGLDRQRVAYSRLLTLVRPLSCTPLRFRYDEFTKKRSEFRIPGISDQRIREQHMLIIPIIWLCALMFVLAYLFLIACEM